MKDEYDPEFDSPEARANFATRHIFNLAERKQKRDELLEKFQLEPVVNMFPGRSLKNKLERIRTELAWIHSQNLKGLESGKMVYLTHTGQKGSLNIKRTSLKLQIRVRST